MGLRKINIDIESRSNDLNVFCHGIYEYKKGVRSLILTTEKAFHRLKIEKRLKDESIDYLISSIGDKKINVFYGLKDCVDIVRSFGCEKLNNLTSEQDFILGIMLGYDKVFQYRRYLDRLAKV